MFDGKLICELAREFAPSFGKLEAVEKKLNQRFDQMAESIRGLILAVMIGEPMLLIGPPGTAKSKLIRAFCSLMGLLDEADPSKGHPDYFEYLLTPFTEPGELFGYYDISQATKGTLVRMELGMMQHARVVYLDEVFNGSSAILNAILSFMNERVFHDRGVSKPVAMKCMFAASNRIPDAPELRALFDRFLLRCRVHNVQARPIPIARLLKKGWPETYAHAPKPDVELAGLLDEMETIRKAVGDYVDRGKLVPDPQDPIQNRIAQLIHHVRYYELSEMSNRRIIKMVHTMMMHRIYETAIRQEFDEKTGLKNEDLRLIYHYFLDREDEESIRKMKVALGASSHSAETLESP